MMSNTHKISMIFCILLAIIAISNAQLAPPTQNLIDYNTIQYTSITNALIIDSNGNLYSSQNSGKTWSPCNIQVSSFLASPQNPQNVIAIGSHSKSGTTLYKSNNGGATWTSFTVNYNFYNTFIPNNNIENFLLALSGSQLYVSKDFGSTWVQVMKGTLFVEVIWEPAISTASEPPQGIFGIAVGGSVGSQLIYTSDFGSSSTTLIPGAQDLESSNNYLYVGAFYQGESILYVRSNTAPVKNDIMGLLECDFPFGEEIQPNSYTIVDDTSGAVYMGIDITPRTTPHNGFASLYVSNSLGNQYTLSAPYVNFIKGSFDFGPFAGIPGAYVFNNVTNPYNVGKPSALKTYITYDNGAKWTPFTPPTPNPSCKGCSLNLYGITQYFSQKGYGPFYTNADAIGFALATGTVNPVLSINAPVDRVNTYFTRDAGQTWSAIFDNPSIYEYINYGSILVLADAENLTNTIMYSVDQGQSFATYTFSVNGQYDVENIITDPESASMIALLLCYDPNTQDNLIFSIDFSTLGLPACDPDNDFEDFNTTRILGQQITYSRRLQNSKCYLSSPPEVAEVIQFPCTFDDYECDIGFIGTDNADGSLTCAMDPSFVAPSGWQQDPPSNCPAGSNYEISRGYRKIAGDRCINGISSQFNPIVKACPGSTSTKSHGWVAALVILLILGLLVAGGAFYLYKNPEVREKVKARMGFSKEQKYSSLSFKPNSLADDEFGIEDDDAQILDDNDLQESF